jgi:hypothetical protein
MLGVVVVSDKEALFAVIFVLLMGLSCIDAKALTGVCQNSIDDQWHLNKTKR